MLSATTNRLEIHIQGFDQNDLEQLASNALSHTDADVRQTATAQLRCMVDSKYIDIPVSYTHLTLPTICSV